MMLRVAYWKLRPIDPAQTLRVFNDAVKQVIVL
jgi:hypothetical protein